jgi:hypothetical protein
MESEKQLIPVCDSMNAQISPSHVPSKPVAHSPSGSPEVGIQFGSTEELDSAIDFLWADPRLRDLPRIHVGRNTMIVSHEMANTLHEQGYQFSLRKVVSAGELSSEEMNKIRREGTEK